MKQLFAALRRDQLHIVFEQKRYLVEYFPFYLNLQLALHSSHLHQRPAIAQDNLAVLVLGNEPDLLKTTSLDIARAPDLGGELVTWANGRRKAGLEFLEVLGVATTEFTQEAVSGGVPAEEAVDDSAAKAHLLAGHGVGVQRVIVTVQTMNSSVGFTAIQRAFDGTYRYRRAVSMSVCTT